MRTSALRRAQPPGGPVQKLRERGSSKATFAPVADLGLSLACFSPGPFYSGPCGHLECVRHCA